MLLTTRHTARISVGAPLLSQPCTTPESRLQPQPVTHQNGSHNHQLPRRPTHKRRKEPHQRHAALNNPHSNGPRFPPLGVIEHPHHRCRRPAAAYRCGRPITLTRSGHLDQVCSMFHSEPVNSSVVSSAARQRPGNANSAKEVVPVTGDIAVPICGSNE